MPKTVSLRWARWGFYPYAMFVSHSTIAVPPGQADALETAFRARLKKVDAHPGFLGLELLRDAIKPGHYLLVTRWETRGDFRHYMRSGDFKLAHERQHPGLDSSSATTLRQFEQVELESQW